MKFYNELNKCIENMEALISKDNLIQLKRSDYAELNMYHFGLGTWIRNNVLTPDAEITKLFIKAGIKEPDDMSSFIIKCFYIKLNLNS